MNNISHGYTGSPNRLMSINSNTIKPELIWVTRSITAFSKVATVWLRPTMPRVANLSQYNANKSLKPIKWLNDEIQLRYVIQDKIQSETKSDPRQNSVWENSVPDKIQSETKFSPRQNWEKKICCQKNICWKKSFWILSWTVSAQSVLSWTNQCLSSLSRFYILQLFLESSCTCGIYTNDNRKK